MQWKTVILGVRWGEKGGEDAEGVSRWLRLLGDAADKGWLPAEGSKGARPSAALVSSVQRWTLAPKVLGGVRAKLGQTHPYLTQQPPVGPHTLPKCVHMLGVLPDTHEFSAAPSVARTTTHVCHAAHGHCTQVCTSTKRSFAQTAPSGWVPGYSLTPKL